MPLAYLQRPPIAVQEKKFFASLAHETRNAIGAARTSAGSVVAKLAKQLNEDAHIAAALKLPAVPLSVRLPKVA